MPLAGLLSLLLLSGCTTLPINAMVKLRQPEQVGTAPAVVRANAVTQNRLSDTTLSLIALSGVTPQQCLETVDDCLQALRSVPRLPPETVLAAHSEIMLYVGKNAGCPAVLPALKNSGASLGRAILGTAVRTPEAPEQYNARPLTSCQQQAVRWLDRSLRSSYVYLFASERKPSDRLFEERQIQVRDFHDDALARLLAYAQQQGGDLLLNQPFDLAGIRTTIRYQPTEAVRANLKQNDQQQTGQQQAGQQQVVTPAQLVAARDLSFEGLSSLNRRDGFGTEFVGIAAPVPVKSDDSPEDGAASQTEDRAASRPEEPAVSRSQADPASTAVVASAPAADQPMAGGTTRWRPSQSDLDQRIHTLSYMPLTLIAQYPAHTGQAVLTGNQLNVDVYSPFQTQSVSNPALAFHPDAQPRLPLAANFSAAYGLWLARTDLATQAFEGLIQPKARLTAPQLFMLEPYRPDKKVILLVHGLAGSPETWISLTNDLLGDPELRERYQVWQLFYSTNMPIIESRYQIQTLIERAFAQVDPQGRAAASRDAVLIGHSMGGVISRMMLSNTDLSRPAFETLSSRERRRLQASPLLQARLQLRPLKPVSRAIFVATPFRGTDFTQKWYSRLLGQLIRLPRQFTQSFEQVAGLALEDEAWLDRKLFAEGGPLHLQNGVNDLDEQSRFNQITRDVMIRPALPYHLIMGRSQADGDLLASSDGVVPYRSAYLAAAASEKVIAGGHSIQEAPAAVLELRRILRLHLAATSGR